jgi:hypothetical protein
MKITVKRRFFLADCMIGVLLVNDTDVQIYTLEDKIRDHKILHETAIPYGSYRVVIDYSSRFKKEMPHILNVPEFTGVRIHPGNTNADTSGCILVGKDWHGDTTIFRSQEAFNELFNMMHDAINNGESIELEVC